MLYSLQQRAAMYVTVAVLALVPPSLALVDCAAACAHCRARDADYPGLLEVYCAMCRECTERRRERKLREPMDYYPEDCPTPPPCDTDVEDFPPPVTLAHRMTTSPTTRPTTRTTTTTTTTTTPTTTTTTRRPCPPVTGCKRTRPPRCFYPCYAPCPMPCMPQHPQMYSPPPNAPHFSVTPDSAPHHYSPLQDNAPYSVLQDRAPDFDASQVSSPPGYHKRDGTTTKSTGYIYVYVGVPRDVIQKAKQP